LLTLLMVQTPSAFSSFTQFVGACVAFESARHRFAFCSAKDVAELRIDGYMRWVYHSLM
jgi:hypothetical protein